MNFKTLKKILNLKFYLKIPKKNSFVIFDQIGSKNIKKYLPLKSYYILYIRNEKFNLYVLIKMLFNLKFSNKAYIKEYIKILNPKVIITCTDNNVFFYQLKLNNIKKIAIQNGTRTNHPSDIFYYLKYNKTNNLSCDYIFTHNSQVINLYKKFIKSKFLILGSLKSNINKINIKKKNFDFVYVSTFRNSKNYQIYKNYDLNEWKKKEILLLRFAERYCIENNKKLTILGREMNADSELKFFKEYLKIDFQFIKRTLNRNVYKLVDQSKVIFGIDSTLLSEALARKAKVGFFSYRGNRFPFNSRKFGWPKKYPDKGEFWDNRVKYENFEKIINYLYKIRLSDWINVCKLYEKDIMKFDSDNKCFKDLIKDI